MYAETKGAADKDPQLATRLAEVSLGVPMPEAGAYLFAHLVTGDVPEELIGPFLHHVARHIAADQVPSIYGFAEVFQVADPSLQLAVVQCARVKRVPVAANRSSAGVFATVSP